MKLTSPLSASRVVLILSLAATSLSLTIAAQNTQPAVAQALLSEPGATFAVPDSELPRSITVIDYGDMRFTDPANTEVANPRARQLLAKKIASEHPDALQVSGDVPYAGANPKDYEQFRTETAAWRAEKLRVYPAIGNHEMVGDPSKAIQNWWAAFPELKGRRWYSVQLIRVADPAAPTPEWQPKDTFVIMAR